MDIILYKHLYISVYYIIHINYKGGDINETLALAKISNKLGKIDLTLPSRV